MAKVGAIISAALRKLRVIDPDMNPEPRQYETAIEELNRMMAEWEADGLPLGWVDVSNPDEDLPAPKTAENAIILNLAVKMRPEAGASIDADLVMLAEKALSATWAHSTTASYNRLTYDLPASEAYRLCSLSEFKSG